MMVAGPINTKEEAQGYEQIAFLTELRTRLSHRRVRSRSMRIPSLR